MDIVEKVANIVRSNEHQVATVELLAMLVVLADNQDDTLRRIACSLDELVQRQRIRS